MKNLAKTLSLLLLFSAILYAKEVPCTKSLQVVCSARSKKDKGRLSHRKFVKRGAMHFRAQKYVNSRYYTYSNPHWRGLTKSTTILKKTAGISGVMVLKSFLSIVNVLTPLLVLMESSQTISPSEAPLTGNEVIAFTP